MDTALPVVMWPLLGILVLVIVGWFVVRPLLFRP
jgi:uncharacterized protein YneF (UPF0154 family)